MSLSAKDLSIVVTVYNRRQFVKQSIASALKQTLPVPVTVVENCGPDPGLEEFIRSEFGSQLEYFRNPKTVSVFKNFNECMRRCPTPWLSILHDDDYLAPDFVERMLELSKHAPDCALYFGTTAFFNNNGQLLPDPTRPPMTTAWRRVNLADTIDITPFPFPGQLIHVESALALGGFRESSLFAGDWELWCKMISRYGAAQTAATVAFNRCHEGPERGCTQIDLKGTMRPLVFVQQKRILHMLRQRGEPADFDRAEFLRRAPMSTRYLLRRGASLTPRLLRYHVGLLARSTPPSGGLSYALFRAAALALGPRFVKLSSKLARVLREIRS